MTIVESASRIRVLPSDLVNQIAAGEVVERPASVVKELVENAIDAGAKKIEIVLVNGGKKLIEISDDGSGMSKDEVLLSLRRHATSKIATFDDLLNVVTLGFRGEALPSIASVSEFSLVTWNGVDAHPVEVRTGPEGVPELRPAARNRGTTVRVEELFHTVPARRKFLKSSDAEFRGIATVVSSYALAAPWRSFRLSHNGRVVVDLPAVATLRDRVLQIVGGDAAPHLEEVECTVGDCRASGFVTRGMRYGSRRNQFFFVNGRLVRDRVLTHAASRAADAFDADGHPAIVLFLEIPPEMVDVNVHPAKTEVRFRDSGAVHVAVEQGIKRALAGASEGVALLHSETPGLVMSVGDSVAHVTQRGIPLPLQTGSGASSSGSSEIAFEVTPLFQKRAVVQPPVQHESSVNLGDLKGRIIGQYRHSYILVDSPEGLRLIDQHAAHERVLFDRIDASYGSRIATQRLLHPFVYEPGAAEGAILDSHLDELRTAGFEVERMSGSSFGFTEIPALLAADQLSQFLAKLIDASADEKRSHLVRVREKIVASLACQAAIKVHRPLSGEEMAQLVGDVLESSNPFACPHGRPVMVDIRHLDVEKHFHRK